jgi:hypothetical protein
MAPLSLWPQLDTDSDAFHAMLEAKGVSADRPVVVSAVCGAAEAGAWAQGGRFGMAPGARSFPAQHRTPHPPGV